MATSDTNCTDSELVRRCSLVAVAYLKHYCSTNV